MDDASLFRGLEDSEREEALTYFQARSFDVGDDLVVEGDIGDEMFYIDAGKADILVDDEKVSIAGPGWVIGEICLIEPGLRTATVKAVNAVQAWVIDTAAFNRFGAERPALALRIALNLVYMLNERLRRVDGFIRLEHEELDEPQDEEETPSLFGRLFGGSDDAG